jgi:hypothetical protein
VTLKITADQPVSGATTKKPDPYGLGEWRAKTVSQGSLFAGHGNNHTAETVVNLFAQGYDPGETAQIQQWLLQGGYYPENYVPVFGHVGPKDISAFRDAVKLSAQTGAAVDDSLSSRARAGAYYGQGQGTNYETTTHTLQLTQKQDLALTAERAFQAAIGRKPTDAELSAFTSEFQGLQRGAQEPVFAAQDQARAAYIAAQSGQGDQPLPLIEDVGNLPSTQSAAQANARGHLTPEDQKALKDEQKSEAGGVIPGDVQKLMAGIRNAESGGDYKSQATGSTASGAYGITDPTWGNYKGFKHAKDAPQQIQDERAAQLVRGKLASYGGDARKVVQSWYYPKYVGKDGLVPPGNTLTMGQYADRVLGSITGRPATAGSQLPVSQTVVVPDMPDASSRAMLYARKTDPHGAYAEDFGREGAAFLSLLRGNG